MQLVKRKWRSIGGSLTSVKVKGESVETSCCRILSFPAVSSVNALSNGWEGGATDRFRKKVEELAD